MSQRDTPQQEFLVKEQRWGAGYLEKGKSGSERGASKPAAAMRQGDFSLLYGDNIWKINREILGCFYEDAPARFDYGE